MTDNIVRITVTGNGSSTAAGPAAALAEACAALQVPGRRMAADLRKALAAAGLGIKVPGSRA